MYYKIVCKVNGNLESFNRQLNTLSVIYKPNEFVYPHVAGDYLAVFDNLVTAINATENYRQLPLEIWECEIEARLESTKAYTDKVYATRGLCEYHPHTVLAHGVKLIKKAELPTPIKIGDILVNENNIAYILYLNHRDKLSLIDTSIMFEASAYSPAMVEFGQLNGSLRSLVELNRLCKKTQRCSV